MNPVCHRALSLLACMLLPTLAQAGAFSISPIRVELSRASRSMVLTITNGGDKSTVVQTQIASWSQAENEDRLEPTKDVIASPPIFTLAPGATQLVRIYLRGEPGAVRETTYRIVLSEVLPAQEAGMSGARFALKLSVPIFVQSLKEGKPRIEWSAKRASQGRLELSITNTGDRHIQVQRIALGDAADPDIRFAGLLYVLPGERRSVMLSPEKGRAIGTGRMRLTAETDFGALEDDVSIDLP